VLDERKSERLARGERGSLPLIGRANWEKQEERWGRPKEMQERRVRRGGINIQERKERWTRS
jgi:hypothetical protein